MKSGFKAPAPMAIWRTHPFAFWSMLAAAFAPGSVLVTVAGIALQSILPRPNLAAVVLGLFLFVALFLAGMIAGATFWLLLARKIVPGHVCRALFVYPGVPFFSGLCARIFDWAGPERQGS